MIPILNQIDRPDTPTIGRMSGKDIAVGTWFLARLIIRGESRLYVKVFDTVADVAAPLNTFSGDVHFFDIRQVAVKIDYWKL